MQKFRRDSKLPFLTTRYFVLLLFQVWSSKLIIHWRCWLQELWESMLEEEQNNKKKIVSTIDRLGRQHHQLCKELGTHYREFGEEIPLLEMEKLLLDTLAGLNKEKEERMRSVRALFQEEDTLCKRLNVENCSLNRDRIPTSEQFAMLQDVITELKTTVVTRSEHKKS